jgi:hypothetical protein
MKRIVSCAITEAAFDLSQVVSSERSADPGPVSSLGEETDRMRSPAGGPLSLSAHNPAASL